MRGLMLHYPQLNDSKIFLLLAFLFMFIIPALVLLFLEPTVAQHIAHSLKHGVSVEIKKADHHIDTITSTIKKHIH